MSAARFIPMIKSRVVPSLAPTTIRSISSTASYQKGPVETAKDTLKQADRTVSDAAVKGINKGGLFYSRPIWEPVTIRMLMRAISYFSTSQRQAQGIHAWLWWSQG